MVAAPLHPFERDLVMLAPALAADDSFAQAVYAALSNMRWQPIADSNQPEEPYSCSWRRAGRLVAELRNGLLGGDEEYTDWYCSGSAGEGVQKEGEVRDDVRARLAELGWQPLPWPDDLLD